MSRRDSRVHISVRQNDALLEFETFKKKFLMANKQITKQNSNLSLKIEELNAHISSLYVENLQLRASEIALMSQLKKERQRSQKILEDAEAATLNLLDRLGNIRHLYSVPPSTSSPDRKDTSPSPTELKAARQRPRSPSAPRLAQAPSVPGISEDPEPQETTSDDLEQRPLSVTRASAFVSKAKSKSSSSRLPVPARVSSPPPPSTGFIHIDLSADELGTKRKLARRPSGLMTFDADIRHRPISPALGAPGDALDVSDADDPLPNPDDCKDDIRKENSDSGVLKKRKSMKKLKVKESESEGELIGSERKERKKRKSGLVASKLKDVTNSPRRRHTEPNADAIADDHGRPTDERDATALMSSLTPPPPNMTQDSYLPTPLPSSANTTPAPHLVTLPSADAEHAATNGRERRNRKSVNYAEPKLNTKMRKPDSVPPPGARPSLSSNPEVAQALMRSLDTDEINNAAAAAKSTQRQEKDESRPTRCSAGAAGTMKAKRHSRKEYNDGSDEDYELNSNSDDDDDGADADEEYVDNRSSWANITMSRRRSAQGQVSGGSEYRKLQREIEDSRRRTLAV